MHTVALEGERCLSNNIAKAEDQKRNRIRVNFLPCRMQNEPQKNRGTWLCVVAKPPQWQCTASPEKLRFNKLSNTSRCARYPTMHDNSTFIHAWGWSSHDSIKIQPRGLLLETRETAERRPSTSSMATTSNNYASSLFSHLAGAHMAAGTPGDF